jgi:hypothetical protein
MLTAFVKWALWPFTAVMVMLGVSAAAADSEPIIMGPEGLDWHYGDDYFIGQGYWAQSLTAVNGRYSRGIRLFNGSSNPISFDQKAITVSGVDAPEFSIGSDTCSGVQVAPNERCTFVLTFAPTSAGKKLASVDIASSFHSSPDHVSISATAAASQLQATLISRDPEAPVTIPGVNYLFVRIQSTGLAPLFIHEMSVAGEHAADYMIGEEFPPGSNYCLGQWPRSFGGVPYCDVRIRFEPLGPGDRSATLSVSSSATDSPALIPLPTQARENVLDVSARVTGLVAKWDGVPTASGYAAEATVRPPATQSSAQATKKQKTKKQKTKKQKTKKQTVTVAGTKARLKMRIVPKSRYRVCVNALGPNMRSVPVCTSGVVKVKRRGK